MSGSYNSMAKGGTIAAPEKGPGISFSKGGPPVFTSKKKKNADPTELATSAQGVQNYDFSKMNMATASKRFVEGEQTETVETTNEDGTKVIAKKAPRQRQQAQENTGFDSDDGFQKASDKRVRAPREGYKHEEEEEEPQGWNRQK